MPINGYHQWANDYATMFGLERESDLRMLASWEGVFEAAGFTSADLRAAMLAIGLNPPKWRTEHLGAILSAVKSAKSQKVADDEVDEGPRCPDCLGAGCCIVPHPRCVVDGAWVPQNGIHYTATVICRCPRGQRSLQKVRDYNSGKQPGKQTPVSMGLWDYELRCPLWREHMAAHAKRRDKESKALAAAGSLDRELGEVIRRVKERSHEIAAR